MILTYFLPMALSFYAVGFPSNTFYKYGTTLNVNAAIPTISCPSDDNDSYYIDSKVEITCSLSYDDAYSWYLSSFNFRITANAYYVDTYTHEKTLDEGVVLQVSTDWEITPSQYYAYLDRTYIYIGLDALQDKVYTEFIFTSDLSYIPSIYQRAESLELDGTWDDRTTTTMEVYLDSQAFFNTIDLFLRVPDALFWYEAGYSDGYTAGFNEGGSVDTTAITVFNGILNVALVPINFFLAIFNFEILGINMSQLVSALLSICLVIIIVRFVTGKKQGGE